MKINKKGFTLIELLAVIAILAILVVIAVPAVLDLFNTAKSGSFVAQAQEIYKAAEQKVITAQLDPGTVSNTYCFVPKNFSESNIEDSDLAVDLSKNNVAYKVVFGTVSDQKVITKIIVMNNDSYIAIEDTVNGVGINDIDAKDIKPTTDKTIPSACGSDATWNAFFDQ